jgi:hypothetical protein
VLMEKMLHLLQVGQIIRKRPGRKTEDFKALAAVQSKLQHYRVAHSSENAMRNS